LLQTWHIPTRTQGIQPRDVGDVIFQKLKMSGTGSLETTGAARRKTSGVDLETSTAKRRRTVDGIRSTLYCPVREPLSEIQLSSKLLPLFHSMTPQPQCVQVWPHGNESIKLVNSKFGMVPIGSVLSYQQPAGVVSSSPSSSFPHFVLPHISTNYCYCLNADENAIFKSLQVSPDQTLAWELETRTQSSSSTWHSLRKHRLTASIFKSVCVRQRDYETLARRLCSGKKVQTAAMKYGIDNESKAADLYVDISERQLSTVGFVVNPSACYLGASPDRRVFDPDTDDLYGLLEIKCSTRDSIAMCPFLKHDSGTFKLKLSHDYYYQVMGQMGITGATWCDFLVMCQRDFHWERIYYDHEFFTEMKNKLDKFYFDHFLPCLARGAAEL